MFVLAAMISAAAVIGVSQLRPDPEQAADGSQRGTTTSVSTTQAPVTTTSLNTPERPTVPAGGAAFSAEVVEVEGLTAPEQIIASGGGYVALGGNDSPSNLLTLYGSSTGQDWVRLAGLLPPDALTSPSPDFTVRQTYGGLAASDHALFVSLIEFVRPVDESQPTRFIAKRLRTLNGSTWTLDSDFETIVVEAAAAAPAFNRTDLTAVAVLPHDRGNVAIEQVVRQHVADPEIADSCWFSAFPRIGIGGQEPGFRLQPCNGGGLVPIGEDQLVDASQIDTIRRCVLQLANSAAPTVDLYLQHRDDPGPIRHRSFGGARTLPVATADERRAVALDVGNPFDKATSCSDLDVAPLEAAPTDLALAFAGPGMTTSRLRGDVANSNVPILTNLQSIAASEGQMIVSAGGSAYRVDLDDGGWSRAAKSVNASRPVWVAPNGQQLFTFHRTTMFTAMVGEPWVAIDLGESYRPSRILHADTERVFFERGSSVAVIDLPQG